MKLLGAGVRERGGFRFRKANGRGRGSRRRGRRFRSGGPAGDGRNGKLRPEGRAGPHSPGVPDQQNRAQPSGAQEQGGDGSRTAGGPRRSDGRSRPCGDRHGVDAAFQGIAAGPGGLAPSGRGGGVDPARPTVGPVQDCGGGAFSQDARAAGVAVADFSGHSLPDTKSAAIVRKNRKEGRIAGGNRRRACFASAASCPSRPENRGRRPDPAREVDGRSGKP